MSVTSRLLSETVVHYHPERHHHGLGDDLIRLVGSKDDANTDGQPLRPRRDP